MFSLAEGDVLSSQWVSPGKYLIYYYGLFPLSAAAFLRAYSTYTLR